MTKPTKTSTDSPLGVSFLPSRGAPGRLGLTLAPGKHCASKLGFRWARDLGADLDRLVAVHRADVLACLLEDHELERLRIPDLVAQAQRRGLEVLRLPIADGGVPPGRGAVEALVAELVARVRAGRTVVVHCAGGLGRAGTIGGCYLAELGFDGAAALAALREARGPRCPENAAQAEFVRAYAARRGGRPAARPHRADRAGRAERVAGAVLGAAIGDAMGHPTEFMSMQAIRQTYGPEGVTGFELWWTRAGRRFAPYTDDTQMAEAVARGLLEARAHGLDRAMRAIAARFVRWAEDPQGGHRGPGNACLAGCRALARGTPWTEAGGPKAGGCGSVMRAYPFGIVFAHDVGEAERWAVEHSKLTHRDPIALAASGAMAVGMADDLGGASVEAVVERMTAAARRYSPRTADMMARAVEEACGGVGPEVTLARLEGWAAHEAIAAAVYVLVRHPDDPRAAILEAANTPGDSDSLATLAGALVGARCGLSALPEAWVRDVERSEALLALAGALAASGDSVGET